MLAGFFMDNKGDLTTMKEICSDLKNQFKAFEDMVTPLEQASWDSATLFYDWTVRLKNRNKVGNHERD